MKIKIIKEFEGLPPVGTEISVDGNYSEYRVNNTRTMCFDNSMFKLALKTGYAEEVQEQWQAWDRVKNNQRYWTIINRYSNISIAKVIEPECGYSDRDFENGLYFHTKEQAEQCLEKVRQTIREFHQEWKNK